MTPRNPTTPRKKLIEVSIPLDAINKASKKAKAPKGYPTALHKWWAPRPLAACRAVLFAQLVDDPSAWPELFPTAEAQERERKRLHDLIERLVPWEASNDERVLAEARFEIARSIARGRGEDPPPREDAKAVLAYLQEKAPPVFDPFCGGGSIPLEAQRLGLRAVASDLNPVAVLITKALVEIPPAFAGRPPVNPKARAELARGAWQGKGAEGLAEDVRFYGRWIREEAERRIGHLYPKVAITAEMAERRPDLRPYLGQELTVIAWLWARTVRSPDPSAKGAMVPLVASFMLSTKEGKKAWVEVVRDTAAPDGWRFEVRTGALSKAEEERLKQGTVGRSSGGTCFLSGAPMPFKYIRERSQTEGLGVRLMAIVAEGMRARIYLPPLETHSLLSKIPSPSGPDGLISHWPGRTNVVEYGLTTFASLFTPRQLVALTTFSDLVGEARAKVLEDARRLGLPDDPTPLHAGGRGATAYADAVATYLGFVVDRACQYGCSVATWLPDDNAIRGAFAQQALPMTWDFCEGNYFGKSSADLLTTTNVVSAVVEHVPAGPISNVEMRNAANREVLSEHLIVNTDPPYYDNVGYADLADFFYVWLRRSLKDLWPELFRRLTTPKDEELVATPYRHGSKEKAEAFFMEGMKKALANMRAAAAEDVPLTIYYSYRQSETNGEGLLSAGWAAFLQAVVDAGLLVDGTWPLRTESLARMVGREANVLASSIVLVCRKRPERAPVITRDELLRALRRELPAAVAAIRKAGVGPVDMQQAVIGPGMAVFSRNARVLEDDDSPMTVKTALALVNRVWDELESELDATLDPETQVALSWYADYGFDARASGELITLANAKNTAIDALFEAGIFRNLKGRAALLARKELPADWRPSADRRLTVWECAQHTARVLRAEDGGLDAAARLVAEMDAATRDATRALAYRLYEIAARKRWTQEALVWNELAETWPALVDRAEEAARRGRSAPEQAALNV